LLKLAITQTKYELGLYRQARKFDPDVMMAMGEPSVAHISRMRDCGGLIFTDTEHATIQNTLTFPLAERVYTPDCYWDDIGPQQIRYPGYHELAYLHPNRFTPDPSILSEAGLVDGEKFVILRLNAWQAAHDVGDSGLRDVHEVIKELESAGAKVVITSEPELLSDFSEYTVDIPLHKMHDLLYYAYALVGESATMAAEAAVLGTPAVFISSSRRGYTNEMESEYGLVSTFDGPERQKRGLHKAVNILSDYDPKKWADRRKQLLDDKIDTTEFMLEQVYDAARNTSEGKKRNHSTTKTETVENTT
jgi:predicted glycosyltransferase